MKILKKGIKHEKYSTSYVRKAACVGCYCDTKPCSPSRPKVLK